MTESLASSSLIYVTIYGPVRINPLLELAMLYLLASFPDLPAHPQTLYARLFFYPLLKKIIARIMFAGERENALLELAILYLS